MSRSDRDRLLDVLESGAAIAEHRQRGPLSDGLVFDAVRVRLIEIGEAVKDVSPPAARPGLRRALVHRGAERSDCRCSRGSRFTQVAGRHEA